MKSPEEIRAEIERLREDNKRAETRGYQRIVGDRIATISALEWVLADEQPKPAKCTYYRGTGWKSEVFTMGAYDSYKRICPYCKGMGDEQDKPKERGK